MPDARGSSLQHLAPLVIAVMGALLLVAGSVLADEFQGRAGLYWTECFDLEVGSTDTAVSIDLEPGGDLSVFDPDGLPEELFEDRNQTGVTYSFQPQEEGRYAFAVGSGWLTFDYYGYSTCPVTPRTHVFSELISHGQNMTYEFEVRDVNMPLIVCVEWGSDSDRIYLDFFGPDGMEIDPSMNGHFTESLYVVPPRREGVYKVVFNGVRVVSSRQVLFNASSNYPFHVPDAGGGDEEGFGMGGWALAGGALLVILAVVGLSVLLFRRSVTSGRTRLPFEEGYSYPVTSRAAPPVPQIERGGPPRPRRPAPPPPAAPQPHRPAGPGPGMQPPPPGTFRCLRCGSTFPAVQGACPHCGPHE